MHGTEKQIRSYCKRKNAIYQSCRPEARNMEIAYLGTVCDPFCLMQPIIFSERMLPKNAPSLYTSNWLVGCTSLSDYEGSNFIRSLSCSFGSIGWAQL